MNFIARTLAESDGNPSTMRMATMLIVCAILAGWLYVTIKTAALQPLSPEHVAMVLGTLGIKGWQRGKESAPEVQ